MTRYVDRSKMYLVVRLFDDRLRHPGLLRGGYRKGWNESLFYYPGAELTTSTLNSPKS